MIAYRPDRPADVVKTQFGFYNIGERANSETFVEKNTSSVSAVTFLNYLATCGREGDIRKFVDANALPQDQLAESIAFAKKAFRIRERDEVSLSALGKEQEPATRNSRRHVAIIPLPSQSPK